MIEDVLNKIKFLLLAGNEAQVIRVLEQLVFDKEEMVRKNLLNEVTADIRNNLSSPKNLVAMLKDNQLLNHPDVEMCEMIRKEMELTLKNIKYLSELDKK